MSDRSIKRNLRNARMVVSFALLGAVAAGAIFGWFDVDLRPAGAFVGAGAAIAYKLSHIL